MKTILKYVGLIGFYAVGSAATIAGICTGVKVYADFIEPKIDELKQKSTEKGA